MPKSSNPYSDIALPDFVKIILNGGEQADEAMYDLLHERLNSLLRKRYEQFQNRMIDNFDDIVEDLFLYLRDGKNGQNRVAYQSLRQEYLDATGNMLHEQETIYSFAPPISLLEANQQIS